ncbi:G-patch domain and KOW motifs-containing protein-like isoform X1 [Macrobrachium nipponense]|uniref:G-patch domain and KOW motifs-containing protein-like isoform X1 n=1 Tax=Macrobrachium nipponense TaxID=159736 RepID=UPI0030C7D098
MSGQKFSLSFTKTIEKRTLQPSAIRNDAPLEAKVNKETLESIEENVMKTDAKPEEPDLVIPMISTDRLGILRKIAETKLAGAGKPADVKESTSDNAKKDKEDISKEQKPLTLEEQAEAAILEETKKKLENWSDHGASDSLAIARANEDGSKEGEPSHGKESSLDDYDQVEVSVFGAALLRGMGWQKTEGIGRHTKKFVEVIDPTAKTFGLANKPGDPGRKGGENLTGDQEDLLMAKGSFVFIHSGRHRGTYGIVESLDEDHLLVKSAVGQDVIREVEPNVRVVSQKEYKDSSRVINKDMYDKFKEEEAQKNDKNKNKSSKNAENTRKEKEIKEEKLLIENSDVREKVKLSSRGTEKGEFQNRDKKIKDEKLPLDKREFADDHSLEKHEETREIKKEKAWSELEKQGSSSKYDDRNRYETKDKYKGKSDSSSDRYSSSYDNRIASKSRYYGDKYQEKYSSSTDDKYSRRSESSRESNVHKRKEKETSDYRDDFKKAKKLQEQMPAIPWVCENLRVRLINKDYKGGRYHKEKVIVKFVETAESCECVTEEGKTLREVHPAWLETVIPKRDPQIVLIVKGKQKGQIGRILQLHKDQEKASVQLLEDKTIILKLHYDDICEYVSQY